MSTTHHNNDIHLKIDIPPGLGIAQVAERAIGLARRVGVPVAFTVNGVDQVVVGQDDPASVAAEHVYWLGRYRGEREGSGGASNVGEHQLNTTTNQTPLIAGQIWASEDGQDQAEIVSAAGADAPIIYSIVPPDSCVHYAPPAEFRLHYPVPVHPIPDRKGDEGQGTTTTGDDSSISLAVGQVWESTKPPFHRVRIDYINGLKVFYSLLDERGCPSRAVASQINSTFRAHYPILVTPAPEQTAGGIPLPSHDQLVTAPESDAPIPLAVGQVWGGHSDGQQATINRISGGWLHYTVFLRSGEQFPGAVSFHERDFRGHYPTLISPAPESTSEPSPSSPSLVDLLASGKRLRFVRDEGGFEEYGFGEWVPSVADVLVSGYTADGEARFAGYVGWPGFDPELGHVLAADWADSRADAARDAVSLLASLGYRYAPAPGEGEAASR